MSTTGGRNRKRSDANRTATRRTSPRQTPAEDARDDEVTATTAVKGNGAGSTALGSPATHDDEVVAAENGTGDPDATDGAEEAEAGEAPEKTKKAGREKPEKELSERARRRQAKKAMRMGNPAWFVPAMLGLFILGLVWIVVFYLSQMAYPIPRIQYWNLVIGFGLLMLGFAMTTRWK